MVVVILGVIAAVAIPRLSRGSQGSAEAAMARDVQVLQKAIDLYSAEHNGAFPHPDMVADQLTLYTDTAGAMSKSKSPPYNYGPYLRKVPPIPSGPNKGSNVISTTPGFGVGWIYEPAEGTITIEGATNSAQAGKQLVFTDFHPEVHGFSENLFIGPSGQGSITFPVIAPPDSCATPKCARAVSSTRTNASASRPRTWNLLRFI